MATKQSLVDTGKVLAFLRICYRLKTTKRTGWVMKGVNQPESISDHMYMASLMAWCITDPTVNKDRCIKMAFVHDLAESIVGDIVPHDTRVTPEQKHEMEKAAMLELGQTLGIEEVGKEFYDLWMEYEKQETPESHVVKQLDKFEMIFQANEYEKAEEDKNLQGFFDSTEGVFKHGEISQWDVLLRKEREERLASKETK
eukprot:TRINITY_DN14142_c0_g1_i1.p1 TRINITY_DN14142_c0_g1~~TRINITY_DN14142_c0_g1_i1.p1  ORF type:complete len:199 (-),score=54.05 TRINITY_DN14142_c0_g1_i1:8-604(-)